MKITAAHIHAEHGRATLRVALEDGSEQDTAREEHWNGIRR